MRAIERDRGSGKTHTLVSKMLERGNEDMIYVAPTLAQAEAIAYRMALTKFGQQPSPELRSRFVSMQEASRMIRGRNVRLLIDEADGVLEALLGAPVEAIAYTP